MAIIVNVVLAGAGSVFLLALLYFFYFYGWTGEREFTSVAGPLVYYMIPACLSVLFFAGLWLRPALKRRVALLTCSTALSLSAVEIVLEAVKPDHTLWSAETEQELERLVRLAARYGRTYDTRSQLQVVRDSRSKGFDVVPSVYPNGFFVQQADGSLKSQFAIDDLEVAVLGGISRRTTVFCNESGAWISYESDEHGFHNPHGIWSSPRIDVAVLGDSFAQGMCVPSDRSFAGIIRRQYPATLNLGMASTGPLMALATLKEYAARYMPRIVLWFLFEENDFGDLRRELTAPLLMRYLQDEFSQGLIDRQTGIDSALEEHVEQRMTTPASPPVVGERAPVGLPAFLRLGNVRERLRLVHGAAVTPVVDHRVVSPETMQLLADILSEAKETVSAWGGEIYLVYLPERERYAVSEVARLDEAIRTGVLEIGRTVGIPVVDMHSAFQSDGDPLALFPFRRRGHYNEEGHRLVGETVLRSMASPE
jgi:hypothetical protein